MTNIIKNPIRPGFFPDPSILRVGNDYYMVNSSFLYFPCIPISHSTDLVNWEVVGHAITNPEYIDFSGYEQGRGLWAPDISYSNGKYYIVATLRGNDDAEITHQQMVVYSDKPEGPYSKPVYIKEKGIDPSLFHDDDGRHYMLFNTSVKIIELTEDCLDAKSPVRILHEGWSKVKTEGPHILKKNGYYYLIMAEGGTGDGHMITVARSRSLDEPFENCPYNPLLTQTDPSAYLQRTGHGKFFVGPDDEWYVVHLCSRKNGGKYSLLGRETAIQKVTWTDDEWPIINDGNGPLNEIEVSYEIPDKENSLYSIDFAKAYPSDVIYYGPYLFTRQTAIDCDVSLSFTNLSSTEDEWGLIFYYDTYSYFKFGIRRDAQRYKLFISMMNITLNDKEILLHESDLDSFNSAISLLIETRELTKEFYLLNNGQKTLVHTIDDCSLVTDEGISYGKRFTGPVVGVFGYKNNPAFAEFTMDNKD